MATTTRHEIGQWDTFHNNGPLPTKVLYKTTLEGKGSMPSIIDRYNDAAAEIQRLLAKALVAGEGFRAYGSAWSMSTIAHQKDNMHFNSLMNLKIAIQADEIHANTQYKQENLFFFQCGNLIKEMSNFLFDHGKSLSATGASNGQTIGGCISTGVHGSALDFGAVQDYVVGINVITGDKPDDIVYLERHTRPALSDAFASRIKSRVIRNDDLFNAALVSLGSFGFIHGVTIEAEDRFLLKRYVKKLHKDQVMALATSMDFSNPTTAFPGDVLPDGKPARPFHYKAFINPYVSDPFYVSETMYKHPYRTDYDDPVPRMSTAIYRDLIVLFMSIAEKYKNSIPKIISVLQSAVLPEVDKEATGTLAEMFYDAPYQGPAYACSVGVPYQETARTLELLTKLAREEGPIPGIYGMRFVKKSEALLACTRFPVTCMLEIDGLIWKPANKKMITLERFCTRMIEVLKDAGIPFTLHWGKNADWKYPGLVQHMYGNDALKWQQHRCALLRKETASLFANQFLTDIGLAGYLENMPEKLAENIPV